MKLPLSTYASFNRFILTVGLLFAVSSVPAHAGLTFDWTITDGTDTVSGQITGLVDNKSNQAATSVFVTAAPTPYFTADYVFYGDVVTNRFDVSNGELLVMDFFASVGTRSTGTSVLTLLSSAAPMFTGISSLSNVSHLGMYAVSSPQITVSRVPEPTSIALLGAGVIAFSVLRKRKLKVVE